MHYQVIDTRSNTVIKPAVALSRLQAVALCNKCRNRVAKADRASFQIRTVE